MAETPDTVAHKPQPYGWPIEMWEEPHLKRVGLSQDDQLVLNDLIKTMHRIGSKENGFWLLLNALIAASGEDATMDLHTFLVATSDIDRRDLNALCAGLDQRIVVVPQPRMIISGL